MALDSEAVLLLRERYGYMRAELLQRLDNRYKILTALLTLITLGLSVIIQLHWDAIGFPLCAAMLAMALVLQGENRHVRLISDYLILIERQLDEHYELETKGWERVSRSRRSEKSKASSRLTIGAFSFLAFFYVIFDLVGVRWSLTELGKSFDRSEWVLVSSLATTASIPLILFLVLAWYDYKHFWKESAR